MDILFECRVENHTIFLPNRLLDRKIYLKVDNCLRSIGGKWDRKSKVHVFDTDPADAFDNMLASGETTDFVNFKKEFQFFETPPAVLKKMLDMVDIYPGDTILEPSAGRGAIARKLAEITPHVDVVELSEENFGHLNGEYRNKTCGDFLEIEPEPDYNLVMMNPPFTRQQDIDHVNHAFKFLKPGGKLVSVMSEGTFFRTNQKAEKFRDFFLEHFLGSVELEPGDFKESGTMVKTRIIALRKP